MLINPHSFQREFPVPHPHPEAPLCKYVVRAVILSLVLEDPRGISGPGTDQESKGSTSPGQSDVSDQNAGRRDNLQTSAGTQDTSWRSPSARRESGRAARAG